MLKGFLYGVGGLASAFAGLVWVNGEEWQGPGVVALCVCLLAAGSPVRWSAQGVQSEPEPERATPRVRPQGPDPSGSRDLRSTPTLGMSAWHATPPTESFDTVLLPAPRRGRRAL